MLQGCKIEKMSQTMDKMGLSELKIETSFLFGIFRKEIILSKKQHCTGANPALSHPMPTGAASPAPTAAAPNIANAIKSPMVGVAYLSPEPGAAPFIAAGKSVKTGDTLCLIEAMKTFNPVKADKDGIIKEILITDGQAVEFDQPLLVLE